MTRQKSEDPVVPEGRRNSPRIARSERGGKGVPVDQEMWQPELPLATAENPRGASWVPSTAQAARRGPQAVPKASVLDEKTASTAMGKVVGCLDEALDHVARNKGAPGSDGLTIAAVQQDWSRIRDRLSRSLLANTYRPGPARRKELAKPGGGVRLLSIPNVEDRVVQEAMRLVLQPLFEPGFHESSHGFRPKRSCHTALSEARAYVADGFDCVVDIDLSKFFDRVNHQRLLARVSEKVDDGILMRTLSRVIRSSVVLPDGVLSRTEEGVPQGGPLSPLLSNIVLDELDRELGRRGHRFTRYADDVAIFVRSKRAGERVMESVTRFIEGRMRLMVNTEKSAVRRPDEGNYLGFRLVVTPGGEVEVRLSDRSVRRAIARIKELTPRNWGGRLTHCVARLNQYWDGWFAYFGVVSSSAHRDLQTLDARARRRLRAIQLKHWKRKRTIVRKLNRMKYSKKVARNVYGGRRSWWSLSFDGVVSSRLNHAWFGERGFVPLRERLRLRLLPQAAPTQLSFEWG